MTLDENTSTILKSALVGANDKVESFGICTPENPMGKPASPKENAEYRDTFESTLRYLHYDYIPILGRYGNVEKSYFIINVNINDLEQICYDYNQESFIYADKIWSKDFESTEMDFYYMQKKKKGRYELLSIAEGIRTTKEANDFFTSLKSFKFNIPFPIFDECIPMANALINEKYGTIPAEQLAEAIVNNIFSDKTVNSRLRERILSYETPEKRERRIKSNRDFLLKHESIKEKFDKAHISY